MNVKLVSAYTEPEPNFVPGWLLANSSLGEHCLVDSADEADVIIFAESYASLDPYFLDVIRHPIYRRHRAKCVLYHYSDLASTLCRTISPSVERHQPNQACRRSFHYIARRRDNSHLDEASSGIAPKHLFSFVGAVETHPVRAQVMQLRHPESLLVDTSQVPADDLPRDEQRAFHHSFVESVLRSRFVLCPRGHGPTSMRLFETMQLGRVPVIIADSWVPVAGIDWSRCAVFVKEADVAQTPAILESLRGDSEQMGRNARLVWEERFSPKHALDQLIKTAASLIQEPHESFHLAQDLLPLFHPTHWRKLAGYWRRSLVKSTLGPTPPSRTDKPRGQDSK